jgi:hypothetical protein
MLTASSPAALAVTCHDPRLDNGCELSYTTVNSTPFMKYMTTAMLPGVLYCCTRLYDIYDLDFLFGALTSRYQVKLGHPDPLNRLQALRSSDDFNYTPQ